MTDVELRADQGSFDAVVRALKAEEDGRALRRDLADELEDAVEPAIGHVRGALLAMDTGGIPHGGEPLRAAVSAGVDDEIILTGRSAGVRVKASSRGMPRGFRNAPKRLNAKRGWRHRVFGRDVWVRQIGAPGWFDDTLEARRERYRRAVVKAMEQSVDRIERSS